MSPEHNKTIARKYVEDAIGKGDIQVIHDWVSSGAVSLNQRDRFTESAAEYRRKADKQLRGGMPDLDVQLDHIVAEGDRVVAYWHLTGTHLGQYHGVNPSGRKVRSDCVTLFKFQGGKIVYTDTLSDRLTVFRQLESTGDYLPVLFGDGQPEGRPELRKGIRARPRRPELEAAKQRAADPFARYRGGDDVVPLVRGAMERLHAPRSSRDFDDVAFVDAEVNGIIAEWVVPEAASRRRRVVHCHGGGWMAGGIESSRTRAVALARLAQASVLTFDYRLAPENPFPAGLDDCCAMLAWAAENGPDGPDANGEKGVSIVLSGDSAGATLAVAACADALTKGARAPDKLVLLSGQLSVVPHLERVARDDKMVIQDRLWYAYQIYTDGTPASDPRISALFTPLEQLAHFPPTLVQVSGDELVLWDAQRFAERLVAADARCVLSVWPDMIHCWHSLLSVTPEAKQALQEAASFITSD